MAGLSLLRRRSSPSTFRRFLRRAFFDDISRPCSECSGLSFFFESRRVKLVPYSGALVGQAL